jgi:hypothetical protein
MMQSCKCFPIVSKMSTPTHNRANSVIKYDIILNIIHNIFNLRDTEVVTCNIGSIKESGRDRMVAGFKLPMR